MPDFLNQFAAAVVDLVAWILRTVVDVGSVQVPSFTTQIYLIALISLPFGALRQFRIGQWHLSVILFGLELYLLYTRLTTFKEAPVTAGALFGNIFFFLLGLALLVPTSWLPRRRDH